LVTVPAAQLPQDLDSSRTPVFPLQIDLTHLGFTIVFAMDTVRVLRLRLATLSFLFQQSVRFFIPRLPNDSLPPTYLATAQMFCTQPWVPHLPIL